jgi:adenylosuccinate synthase
VAYEVDGVKTSNFPTNATEFARCIPIYETMPGWKQPTDQCRSLEELPAAALEYLHFLAELMEVPIAIISLGAGREQTIIVEDPIHGPKRALLYSNENPLASTVKG